jgi:hypothetical protein
MKRQQYSPKEALERVKLMMNYDSRKTLTENKKAILNEDGFEKNYSDRKTDDDTIVNDLITSTIKHGWFDDTITTNEKLLVSAIKRIKDKNQFYKINNRIKNEKGNFGDFNSGGYQDITSMVNGELEGDNIDTVSQITKHLNSIGVPAKYDTLENNPNFFKVNSFSIGSVAIPKTNDDTVLEKIYQIFPCLKTDYIFMKFVKVSSLNAVTAIFKNKNTGNIYQIFTNGRAVDKKTNKMITFSCKSSGGGNKPPKPKFTWVESPSCDDVFKGVAKIKKGMKGECVTNIQNQLKTKGFDEVGNPDGKFGGKTQSAIMRLQRNGGLNQTGIVDTETYKYLFLDSSNTPETETLASKEYDGTTTQPELQLPNNQLQQAAPIDQNMTGKQKRQFNRFVRKQERNKNR